MTRRKTTVAFSFLAATAAIAALSACGGGGGGGVMPSGGSVTNSKPTAAPQPTPTATPAQHGRPTPTPGIATPTPKPTPTSSAGPTSTPLPTPTPQPTSTPTSTPTPSATSSPQNLPILSDTSTATTGVFLGAVCTDQIFHCSQFATMFRHGIALSVTYVQWTTSLDSVFKYTEVGQWNSEGITPEVTWEPQGMNLSDIAAGKYDNYIISAADVLKGLGYTVFLRPFHEFNGGWYSWGLPNQGADSQADVDFINAWQHMVNVFRAQGATNVKFVWCFASSAIHNSNPWDNPANAYPGDAYVDWVSFDGYNRGSVSDQKDWMTFDQMVSPAYSLSVQIAPSKPVLVAEGASNEYGDGGSMKAAWIQNMFSELSSPSNPYPHMRAFTWFEVDPNAYHYDTLSSQAATDSFILNMRSYNQSGVLNIRSNNQVLNAIVTP